MPRRTFIVSIVFRFDWRSVSAISILFGIVVIAAGIDASFAVFAEERSGCARVGHAVLAVACFVIGIVPGGSSVSSVSQRF